MLGLAEKIAQKTVGGARAFSNLFKKVPRAIEKVERWSALDVGARFAAPIVAGSLTWRVLSQAGLSGRENYTRAMYGRGLTETERGQYLAGAGLAASPFYAAAGLNIARSVGLKIPRPPKLERLGQFFTPKLGRPLVRPAPMSERVRGMMIRRTPIRIYTGKEAAGRRIAQMSGNLGRRAARAPLSTLGFARRHPWSIGGLMAGASLSLAGGSPVQYMGQVIPQFSQRTQAMRSLRNSVEGTAFNAHYNRAKSTQEIY